MGLSEDALLQLFNLLDTEPWMNQKAPSVLRQPLAVVGMLVVLLHRQDGEGELSLAARLNLCLQVSQKEKRLVDCRPDARMSLWAACSRSLALRQPKIWPVGRKQDAVGCDLLTGMSKDVCTQRRHMPTL